MHCLPLTDWWVGLSCASASYVEHSVNDTAHTELVNDETSKSCRVDS